MEFSIMFFASANQTLGADKYSLVRRAARFADARGFRAIWTPERHFHEFGGIFPNPSVMTAALAMITERVELRGGSVVSPLHHAVRVAEEWSVADNLSQGRVSISFGSGWNVDDFVFFPERYAGRRDVMFEQIEDIRRLWRGEPLRQKNGAGNLVDVMLSPRPIQPELPVWISSSGNAVTFARAGQIGANVLTHLLGQDVAGLAENVAVYRRSCEHSGARPARGGSGTVSLMLHTFLGADLESVRDAVRGPFRDYLRSALKLEMQSAQGGGVASGGKRLNADDPVAAPDLEALVDLSFDRYFEHGALIGTLDTCGRMVQRLEAAGVDEIACLIDFGVEEDRVAASLELLDRLRADVASRQTDADMSLVNR